MILGEHASSLCKYSWNVKIMYETNITSIVHQSSYLYFFGYSSFSPIFTSKHKNCARKPICKHFQNSWLKWFDSVFKKMPLLQASHDAPEKKRIIRVESNENIVKCQRIIRHYLAKKSISQWQELSKLITICFDCHDSISNYWVTIRYCIKILTKIQNIVPHSSHRNWLLCWSSLHISGKHHKTFIFFLPNSFFWM